MSEIKILDLPEQAAQGQDYALIVKPDGTHVRTKVADLPGSPRKIDNWQVGTFADAQALSVTLSGSAFIEVIADETQGGIRALYFWNTVELQEPLLL